MEKREKGRARRWLIRLCSAATQAQINNLPAQITQ